MCDSSLLFCYMDFEYRQKISETPCDMSRFFKGSSEHELQVQSTILGNLDVRLPTAEEFLVISATPHLNYPPVFAATNSFNPHKQSH